MSWGLGFKTPKVSTIVRKHGEHELQSECKAWFDSTYPGLSLLFFAVPNGGSRLTREAVRLKAEGVVPGVADTILLVPNAEHCALCVEFKYGDNKQSARQMAWEKAATGHGARYAVVYKKEDFITLVSDYLKNVDTGTDNNRRGGSGSPGDDYEHHEAEEDVGRTEGGEG
jgi:hypothetical protein